MLSFHFNRAAVSPDSWRSMVKMASHGYVVHRPWLQRLALHFNGSGKKLSHFFCRDENNVLIILVIKKLNTHYDHSEALPRNTDYYYTSIQINMILLISVCIAIYNFKTMSQMQIQNNRS